MSIDAKSTILDFAMRCIRSCDCTSRNSPPQRTGEVRVTGPPSPPRGPQNAPAAFSSDSLRIPTHSTVERLEQNDDQLATMGDSKTTERVSSDAVLVLRSVAMDSGRAGNLAQAQALLVDFAA